jgi:hypothetical protein
MAPSSSKQLCIEVSDGNCGDIRPVENVYFVAMCSDVPEVSASLIVLDVREAAMVGKARYLNFVESSPLRFA